MAPVEIPIGVVTALLGGPLLLLQLRRKATPGGADMLTLERLCAGYADFPVLHDISLTVKAESGWA